MNPLRTIGAAAPSGDAAAALTAALVAAPGTEQLPLADAEALAAEMRRGLTTHPGELQLWMRASPVPVTAAQLRSTRLETAPRSAWGRVFALYDSASLLTPAVRDAQVAAGTHVRVRPVPFTMLVIGHDLAYVGRLGDDVAGHRVVDRSTVAELRGLFLRLWSDSAAVAGDPAGSDVLWLVRLLTSGLPDQAAAARMGVSLRTYRRRISELSGVLGVHGRFAAGVEADRRGLIELAERVGITAAAVGEDVAS